MEVIDVKFTGQYYEVELTNNNGYKYIFQFDPNVVMNATTKCYGDIKINEMNMKFDGFRYFDIDGKQFYNGHVTFPVFDSKMINKVIELTHDYMVEYEF